MEDFQAAQPLNTCDQCNFKLKRKKKKKKKLKRIKKQKNKKTPKTSKPFINLCYTRRATIMPFLALRLFAREMIRRLGKGA